MKAPDKIYVVNILDDSLPNNTRGIWSCVEVEGLMNIGYIRKDLLLEWVNAMGKCSPSVALLAHELIRKINSL